MSTAQPETSGVMSNVWLETSEAKAVMQSKPKTSGATLTLQPTEQRQL